MPEVGRAVSESSGAASMDSHNVFRRSSPRYPHPLYLRLPRRGSFSMIPTLKVRFAVPGLNGITYIRLVCDSVL